MAGVTPAAVVNWRSRHTDFPEAVSSLQSGPVFNLDQIQKWLRTRRKGMSTTISTINLKGGVAKTTTTVALGEFLSEAFRKRVLIIDLDPQTNATTMLIGEEKWDELNRKGHTLATLFKDALDETHKFDLEKTRQKGVSNVRDVRTLDLIPSSRIRPPTSPTTRSAARCSIQAKWLRAKPSRRPWPRSSPSAERPQ